MPRPEPSVDTRIIVLEVELADEAMTVALIADKVHEVTEIAASALEETPRIGLRWRQDYIRCIAKRDGEFIVVLDIAAIFSVETRRSDRPDDRSKASNASLTRRKAPSIPRISIKIKTSEGCLFFVAGDSVCGENRRSKASAASLTRRAAPSIPLISVPFI